MPTFPHYTQLDQMDCGPTCLRMVAKHYGRSYSVQSLRAKSQIGKEGVSLLGISEAAEAIGFRTMGVKIPFEKLVSEAPLPCVVHWDQNHFVVVYAIKGGAGGWMSRIKGGRTSPPRQAENPLVLDNDARHQPLIQDFRIQEGELIIPPKEWTESPPSGHLATSTTPKGTVYVADPGKGLVTYSAAEFCQHWLSSQAMGAAEGVVLLLEPTPAFFEQDDEPAPTYSFERVGAYLWQYKRLLAQLALGLAVGSGLQLLFPFLTQSVVDVGVNTHNLPFVYLVLGAQLMLMGGRLSVEFIRSWILLHISTRVNLSILSDFLIKLMKLPVSFFDSKQFGDIMQRIGDHHRIESFLTGQTLSVLFSMVNLLVFGVVLALYNLSIFSIFLLSSVLYMGWVMLFLRQRRKLDYKRFDVSAKNQSSLVQLIQGMQEIKLAGAERPMRWAWERLQARLFRLQMKGMALSQYQQAGAFAINEGKNIFITFLAAQSVINGQLSLGAMLAMQQIIGQLNSPIEQLIGFVQSLQDAKISLERLNEIHTLDDEEPPVNPSDRSNGLVSTASNFPFGAARRVGGGTLQLNNLSFQYPGAGNEPVLQGIDLVIPEGKTTAIVGMSGSGKTTLLKLLLRFYEPTKGDIRVGEGALRNISHSFWRSQCGVVMQDGFLFSDTIARNIAVGAERIDARKLDHAVQVANLSTFIDSLPSGLHTKIGAEGSGISQGQRQRILIARAVYKDPHYIFFDEATNALDANNEATIVQNLNEFFQSSAADKHSETSQTRRTVVIVAHRLSTVRHANQIVVLAKGHITEVGTHAELVANRGDYWQLVKNQLELSV
ncbi:peptidase domain-containing ABC transporter [Spirosoma linguale]|uniref:ABC transporter related protein n=1 Tax=Spirosoma linguale (strain ATCC 33905 / DSM 74 / LMG 10896 / Claus 1) TaxID=504472 RepID=D2QH78_SPILD|nr:ABC transporter related protein [Spirosoma linguale DSM 74]